MNGLLSKVPYSQTTGSIIKQGYDKAQYILLVKVSLHYNITYYGERNCPRM